MVAEAVDVARRWLVGQSLKQPGGVVLPLL
jgi:hypothetical protein